MTDIFKAVPVHDMKAYGDGKVEITCFFLP